MGQKIDPRSFRLGITKGWNFRWFNKKSKNYRTVLRQDVLLTEYIKKKYKSAAIASVDIERSIAKLRIIIRTNRPGVIIGKVGKGLELLRKDLERKFLFGEKLKVVIDVKEVKSIYDSAQLLADDAAVKLEKRGSFRAIMKRMVDETMRNKTDVLGVKVQFSGRLGGAEMSRSESYSKGRIPLHTLRADIDFAKSIARTTYGVIGIKVWLNKGESAKR